MEICKKCKIVPACQKAYVAYVGPVPPGVETCPPCAKIDVCTEIRAERFKQDEKWGGPAHDDNHDFTDWISYIVKHLGKCVVWSGNIRKYRGQLVRVAALAVAAIESFDRKIDNRP